MRARTLFPRVAIASIGGALLLSTTGLRAQSSEGFAVDRFEPAERGASWLVVDDLDFRGRLRPAFGATLDYAHKPLVVFDAAENERLAIVRHQLIAHPGASLVVSEWLRFGLVTPFAAYQDGESAVVRGERLRAATEPAFGDVRVAVDVRVLGRHGDAVTLAAGARAWLPTGVRSQFTSDGTVRFAPQLLASGELGAFVWAARAAIVLRPHDEPYAGSTLGSELGGAVGAGARLGRFRVGPELFAATRIDGPLFARAQDTPADAVLGVHWESPSGVRIGLGAGSGLSRGLGSPALRALASIEWAPPIAAAPAAAVSPEPEIEPEYLPPRPPAPPAPKPPLAVATETEISISEQIQFATDSADLVAASDGVLAAVKRILDEHSDIRRVRIEGHTDDTGNDAYNDDLSRRRAAAVMRWLVERGVDAARLTSEGYGRRVPLEPNDTEAGRARNRRVVFTIVERAPNMKQP